MIVASWNVNSIRARLDRVLAWLDQHQPDVLCMQELKSEEKDFPLDAFTSRGWRVESAFQRTYNGVAIATRAELADVTRGLDDDVDDPQARLIAATVRGVRVLSVYAPNGQAVGSDKYEYKLAWLDRLRAYLERRCKRDDRVIVCGDFNVAPEPRDVYDPLGWESEPLYHLDARAALERVRAWGLVDTFRLHHQQAAAYSWWDYRLLAFPNNHGLRIDHVFASEPLARRCTRAWIDREARKGEQPSDHAPVLAEFENT